MDGAQRAMSLRRHSRLVTSIALVVVASHLPWLLARAATADEAQHQSIPMIGDDGGYHIPAVNLIHGYGYSDAIHLPIEAYNLDLTVPAGAERLKEYLTAGPAKEPWYSFNWAPGTTLMLAGAYAVFGSETMVARRLMAASIWLTALMLVLIGASMAGGLGALAGGLAAVYHLHYFPGAHNFERILSESPTALLIALFCAVFSWFVKHRNRVLFVLSAVTLSAVLLARANFLPALFVICVYLRLLDFDWRRIILFAAVALLPTAAWAGYASIKKERFVLVNVQGQTLFAETNNMDTLEGIGPARWNQGGWNPGHYQKPDGTWEIDGHNQVKPGENGYVKGLTFWKDNLARVPELFYIKLRHGFWFSNGQSLNRFRPEGFFLIGIGYLLLAVGFLPMRIPFTVRSTVTPQSLLAAQIGLIGVLALLWNMNGLAPILVVWAFLLVLSLLRLSMSRDRLPCDNPVWLLAFVAAHAVTTIMYYGIRFHQPIDPPLMFVALLGLLMTTHETVRRSSSIVRRLARERARISVA